MTHKGTNPHTYYHRRFDQLMPRKLQGPASSKNLTDPDKLINADRALMQLVLQSLKVAAPDEKKEKTG